MINDLKLDNRWPSFGVTGEFLEEKAAWIREPRRLHDSSLLFFELAAKLLLHSRSDYLLSSLAFFQTVIGLERALRIHFDAEEKPSLHDLLGKAVQEGVIHDGIFEDARPLSKDLLKKVKERPVTHAERLALLVPRLRNEFMHGIYLLSPDYLHLAFQLREAADALRTKRF